MNLKTAVEKELTKKLDANHFLARARKYWGTRKGETEVLKKAANGDTGDWQLA